MTSQIADCKCKKATPWTEVKGNESNVCKVCGGKIIAHPLPEVGRLHRTLDTVLLGDMGLDPDHPFIAWLTDCIREDLRQKKLGWDYNRAIGMRQIKPT